MSIRVETLARWLFLDRAWFRWLTEVQWHAGVCWNPRGGRTFEVVGPFLYDLRIHYGFSCGLFTVGWWRDAVDSDWRHDRRHGGDRPAGIIQIIRNA